MGDIDRVALLRPLPFAQDELAAIRRAFPATTDTLSGREARETSFRRADLGRYSIVHFATHGLVNETPQSHR
jgi:CHAT domain-containing protein